MYEGSRGLESRVCLSKTMSAYETREIGHTGKTVGLILPQSLMLERRLAHCKMAWPAPSYRVSTTFHLVDPDLSRGGRISRQVPNPRRS